MKSRMPRYVTIPAIFALLLIYAPMLAVVVFSVNKSRSGFVWRGWTLDWYRALLPNQQIDRNFQPGPILEAARNTLILAVVSTAIATVLGTLLAIGISRFPWSRRARNALDTIVYLPVVTPDIVFAAALVVAFGILRELSSIFNPGLLTMILAHVTFQIAFVAIVVNSRLATIGRTLEEAARDLYATRLYLMRHVTLPLLKPGIIAGAMLAFTLSLDDFVISYFTYGSHSTTLPILIYSSVRRGITPEMHALSTLILLFTVLLVLGLQSATRSAKE